VTGNLCNRKVGFTRSVRNFMSLIAQCVTAVYGDIPRRSHTFKGSVVEI
jgi:hypothetical protein